jgi:hypothetical protein
VYRFTIGGQVFTLSSATLVHGNADTPLTAGEAAAHELLFDQVLQAAELRRQTTVAYAHGSDAGLVRSISFNWEQPCRTIVYRPKKSARKPRPKGPKRFSVALSLMSGSEQMGGLGYGGLLGGNVYHGENVVTFRGGALYYAGYNKFVPMSNVRAFGVEDEVDGIVLIPFLAGYRSLIFDFVFIYPELGFTLTTDYLDDYFGVSGSLSVGIKLYGTSVSAGFFISDFEFDDGQWSFSLAQDF